MRNSGNLLRDTERKTLKREEKCTQNGLIDSIELETTCIPRKKVKTESHKSSGSIVNNLVEPTNSYAEIEEVPTVKLTDEEMRGDPIKLFMDLEKKYHGYGAVKVVASDNWNPPFCFGYSDKGITTRVQQIHKLSQGKPFSQKRQAYNVSNFSTQAQQFQEKYKFKTDVQGDTPGSQRQMEFWNIVNNKKDPKTGQCKYKLNVEYAADLPVVTYGSGFPLSDSKKSKDEHFDYHKNLFNLNNLYQSPLSLTKIIREKKEFISGVTSPWVYMGMMFSAFCWHVEDVWLNSVNYSHRGAVKTWYVIPTADKEKFDEYVMKKTGQQDVLDRITYMIDPLQVIRAGIRVYKVNQAPKQYVCTFFKAYHCGFSNGFNVGQAVNFVSPLSIGYIKQAVQHYNSRKIRKPLVFPYEWLVYANRGKQFGQMTAIVQKEYNEMIEQEFEDVQLVLQKYRPKTVKQFLERSKYDKIMCCVCKEYLYLWTLKCQSCKKFYCRNHLNQCCGNCSLMIREFNPETKKLTKLFRLRSNSLP